MSRHDEIVARMREIQTELERLDQFDHLTAPQGKQFRHLRDEFEDLDEERGQVER